MIGVVGLVAAGFGQIRASTVAVMTTSGVVVGNQTQNNRVWRGIAYAQAPVGVLRWKPPQQPTPWTQPREAFFDGPGCMQYCVDGTTLPPHTCPPRTSEDCLTVNIFAPKDAPPTPLPVLVWIHGGNFQRGFGGGVLYDGSRFAANTDTIVVTIQYRLGAFGWLFSGGSGNITGNYGLMDQRHALRWISHNIKAFGGDRDKVTLFGQSAGAMSIGCHAMSPLSKNLFHRAIMESNPFGLPFRTKKSFLPFAKVFTRAANCSTTGIDDECLRAADADRLVQAQAKADRNWFVEAPNLLLKFMPWTPLIDPQGEIHERPMDAWANARLASRMPIMMGTVAQEGQMFVYEGFTDPVGKVAGQLILDAFFGVENAKLIAKQYPWPDEPHADIRDTIATIATDALFACAVRNATLGLNSHPHTTHTPHSAVFVYEYAHPWSFARRGWGPHFAFCYNVSCHAAELPFVFCPNAEAMNITLTAAEEGLCDEFQQYWAQFARDGRPGSGPTHTPLEWPQFSAGQHDTNVNHNPDLDPTHEASLLFETPRVRLQHRVWSDKCRLWDAIGYDFLGGIHL